MIQYKLTQPNWVDHVYTLCYDIDGKTVTGISIQIGNDQPVIASINEARERWHFDITMYGFKYEKEQ